jgi:RNA polymerase sigma-70 factor, ECF subfamily
MESQLPTGPTDMMMSVEPSAFQAEAARRLEFRAVFDRYENFVLRTLRRFGVPSSDLHDICQNTFVVIHRKLPDFDGRASIRTWIYAICVRTALAHRRSLRARARREEPCENPEPYTLHAAPDSTRQDRDLDARRAVAAVESLLAALDDDKRRVVVLHEFEGLSMAEIASALGCPLQTAYSRLHAARKAMRVSLERQQLNPLGRS